MMTEELMGMSANVEILGESCKQSSKIQKFSPENAEFFGVNFLL